MLFVMRIGKYMSGDLALATHSILHKYVSLYNQNRELCKQRVYSRHYIREGFALKGMNFFQVHF